MTPQHANIPEHPSSSYEEQLKATAKRLPLGTGLFQLMTDCVYLDVSQNGMRACTIFGQTKRPQVCSDFSEGGETCKRVRLTRGMWDYGD